DVKPGTRQSLTVFHHLDGHRPYQLRLALIEWRAMNHVTQRSHHTLDLTRLEEVDRAERRLGVREQPLQVVHRRGRALAARRLERPLLVAARQCQLVQHEHHDVYAVEQRVLQSIEPGHTRHHVVRLVRDALDPIRVVLARAHQPQVAKPEILERPHHVGDVDEVLGLVQHDGDGHPTSARMPNRSGSWPSPRIHTQPFPPLQTSCPARRVRPDSISFTSRSNRSRPPTCARCHSGHAMPSVTVYPRSVRRHAPRTPPGSAEVSLVARTRSPVAPVSGTTRYPTRPSPPPSPATYTCRPSEWISSGSLSRRSGGASPGRMHSSGFTTSTAR